MYVPGIYQMGRDKELDLVKAFLSLAGMLPPLNYDGQYILIGSLTEGEGKKCIGCLI